MWVFVVLAIYSVHLRCAGGARGILAGWWWVGERGMVYCVVMITTLTASCKVWKRYLCAGLGRRGIVGGRRHGLGLSFNHSLLFVVVGLFVIGLYPPLTLIACWIGSCLMELLIRNQFVDLDSKNYAKFVEIWGHSA